MNTQKFKTSILVTGATLITLYLAFMLVMGASDAAQKARTWQNTSNISRFQELLQIPMGLLLGLAMIAFVVWLWMRILQRHNRQQQLSELPLASTTYGKHLLVGKYLPWGRNMRRHAGLTAQRGDVRTRKTLRPRKNWL